jgi:hypothetical protein
MNRNRQRSMAMIYELLEVAAQPQGDEHEKGLGSLPLTLVVRSRRKKKGRQKTNHHSRIPKNQPVASPPASVQGPSAQCRVSRRAGRTPDEEQDRTITSKQHRGSSEQSLTP